MSNPFDALEIARDLTRRDECDYLFDKVRAEEKRSEEDGNDGGYVDGYYAGLNFVMNVLDMRITYLRDRWIDAE